MSSTTSSVAILGGTGQQGRGLATRFAAAGIPVIIGSRDPERAAEVAATIGSGVTGTDLASAAASAQIVVVAVPWDAHAATLTDLRAQLAGRIVIDCVNPIVFRDGAPVALPVEEGSACQQAAALLPESTVVGAFHHIAAKLLADMSISELSTDVLVVADDDEAAQAVCDLVDVIPGMRGVRAGRLRDAGQVEALTVNLIHINKRLKIHSGIRITGIQ